MCLKSKNVRVFLGLSWTEKESPVPLYTPAEKETGCLLMMQGKTRGNPEGGGDLRDGDTGVDEGNGHESTRNGEGLGHQNEISGTG